jgi:hypothetical protein
VFTREPLPYEAGFLAGKCHRNYRLLTRNAPRFRSYFPTIQLIAPQ